MPIRSRALFLAPALLLLASSAARTAHPVVPGYERFYPDKADARAGELLRSELGCARCHQSADKTFPGRSGPILDHVGGRVRASWLRKYLADPHAVKPGTAMPDLLAGDSDREAKVEALVQLLASTGGLRQERVAAKSIGNGRQLYERSGCVACHGTRKANGDADKVISTQVPLGDLKAKYSVPSLATFLQDPLHVRPGGRMPRILDAKEAKEVANYLLQGIKVEAPGGKGSSKYAYYEGDFGKVPDFARMKTSVSGTAQGFDISVARRESNYAIRFEAVLPIDQDGTYTFTLHSDDGSLLWIDDKLVVDNDGIHAPQSKSGRAKLKKGVRKVVVGFIQGGGGAELEVKMSGPGQGEVDLGNVVAATEADLKKRPPAKVEGEDALVIKPDLVSKGKEYFASLGCASCHDLKIDGKAVASTRKAAEMEKLDVRKGCLAEKPAKGVPHYGLSEGQRKALGHASRVAGKQKPEAKVADTMLAFNCYACHVRDKVGGPQDELNKAFQTTQPEMGDEGRLPPPLDGVGAKLNPDYFKKILDQGAHDRPYMHTRMPGFGSANVGHLPELFASSDRLPAVPEVKFDHAPARVKAEARKLAGAEALGCIKCHTFNNKKAEGVQGIDMLKMPQRLRREWFHAYINDPQAIRPGTRMPATYVKGKSVLPEILDGTALQQIEAMWLYLKDGGNARLPLGVGPAYIPLTPTKSAILYRNFIEGMPRAIAVGYPEKSHLAFDANDLRIALIWQGLFLDASLHWTDRGAGFQGPLGDNVVKMPAGPTFALLEGKDAAWPGNGRAAGQKFKGYKLTKDDRPTFQYTVGEVSVEDFPNAVVNGKEYGIKRSFTLKGTNDSEKLYFRAAAGNKVEALKDGWFKVDDAYRVKLDGTGTTWLRKSGGKTELMYQPTFKDGKATVTQEYAW